MSDIGYKIKETNMKNRKAIPAISSADLEKFRDTISDFAETTAVARFKSNQDYKSFLNAHEQVWKHFWKLYKKAR